MEESDIEPPPPSKPHNWWCKPCRKHFTATTGTVMHSCRRPLQDWIYTIYSVLMARKGVSALQLSKELELPLQVWGTTLVVARASDKGGGMNKKHYKEFKEVEREEVSEQNFLDALNALLGGKTDVRFENKEPTKKELEKRYKLQRRA